MKPLPDLSNHIDTESTLQKYYKQKRILVKHIYKAHFCIVRNQRTFSLKIKPYNWQRNRLYHSYVNSIRESYRESRKDALKLHEHLQKKILPKLIVLDLLIALEIARISLIPFLDIPVQDRRKICAIVLSRNLTEIRNIYKRYRRYECGIESMVYYHCRKRVVTKARYEKIWKDIDKYEKI